MKYRMFPSLLLFYATLRLVFGFCEENDATKNWTISNKMAYSFKSFPYNGTISECNCDSGNTCIRKCCDVNYELVNSSCVYNSTEFKFGVYNKQEELNSSFDTRIISGLTNCHNSKYYKLEPDDNDEDKVFLQSDGRLWHMLEDYYTELDSYCLDSIDGQVSGFVCFPQTPNTDKHLNMAGMILSMPFLFATFLIYALLPNLNIHGKSLICYVLALLLAYIFICLINSIAFVGIVCTGFSLLCLFFFIASFFWMNVMSIDMWWTFSGKRDSSGNTKEVARRHFVMYSVYAWGVPCLLTLIVACLNAFTDKNSWYHPGINDGLCWFKKSIPELIYFYGPLALIIIINLSLFGLTALKIRKMQKDTAVLRSGQFQKHSEDHEQFKLYIKLSLAMGVNWIMEIISWAVTWQVGTVPPAVWYLTDFCNAAYGVIIFFIFAFKKKIWKTLRNRYPCGKKQTSVSNSNTTEICM